LNIIVYGVWIWIWLKKILGGNRRKIRTLIMLISNIWKFQHAYTSSLVYLIYMGSSIWERGEEIESKIDEGGRADRRERDRGRWNRRKRGGKIKEDKE